MTRKRVVYLALGFLGVGLIFYWGYAAVLLPVVPVALGYVWGRWWSVPVAAGIVLVVWIAAGGFEGCASDPCDYTEGIGRVLAPFVVALGAGLAAAGVRARKFVENRNRR